MAATATPVSDLTSFLSTAQGGPDVTRLYDNVQAQVPAVQLPIIEMQLWNTIEQFFLRSTVRRERVFWQMPKGAYAVDFNPYDANWLVGWILQYNGLSQAKIEPPGLLRDIQYPQSQSLRTGQVVLALKPSSFAADFGPLIWQQWFETILDGTLFRLYGMPAKPWSNPQLAQYFGREFKAGISRARAFADRNADGTGLPNYRFPYFAAGRRKN